MTYHPDELAQFDTDFAEAPMDDENTGKPVPPGKYQAVIQKAEIRENKYNGYPELNLHCKILDGAGKGQVVFPSGSFDPNPNDGLKGEKPITYLKRLLTRLDLDPPITAASQVPGRLRDMLDMVVEVAVVENKKRPEYPRAYINRAVGRMAPTAERGPGDDDVIPF